MKKCLRLIIVVLILFPVLSQGAISYKVSPLIIDEAVERRDIIDKTITLTNHSSSKITIFPTVNPVAVDASGEIEAFISPAMSDRTSSMTSWLEFRRASLELAPGESYELPLRISVHPEAEAGEYHAFIGFGQGRTVDDAQRQVVAGTAPGVFIRLEVAKTKNEFLKLAGFTVKRFVTGLDNKAITYTLTNPGDAPLVPEGEIIFYNQSGEEVASVPVNSNHMVLTPGQESTISLDVPAENMLGKYRAFLNIDYGETQKASVYDSVYFYVIDWKPLAIAFILVITISGLLSYRIVRKHKPAIDPGAVHNLPVYFNNTQTDSRGHDLNLRQDT